MIPWPKTARPFFAKTRSKLSIFAVLSSNLHLPARALSIWVIASRSHPFQVLMSVLRIKRLQEGIDF